MNIYTIGHYTTSVREGGGGGIVGEEDQDQEEEGNGNGRGKWRGGRDLMYINLLIILKLVNSNRKERDSALHAEKSK